MFPLLYFFILIEVSDLDVKEFGPYASACQCQEAAEGLDGYAGSPSKCYSRLVRVPAGSASAVNH
jgi:hypothetical protein